MKLRAKILLLVLIALYFVTKWARTHFPVPDFFRNHFTDLLFIPVQLMIALWATRWIKRDQSIRISLTWIFLQVIFMSLLFEWYMPNYATDHSKFTADSKDVFMYLAGGFAFAFIQHWESKIQNVTHT